MLLVVGIFLLRHGAGDNPDMVQRAADFHIPRIAQHVLAQLHGQQHAALIVRLHAGIAEFGHMVQLLLYGGLAPVEGVKLIDHGFKRLVRVDGDGPVIETDGDGEALAQRFAVGVGDDDAALGVDGVVVATEKLEFVANLFP